MEVADRAIMRFRARRRHHVLGALAIAATVAIAAPMVASTVGDQHPAPPVAPPSTGIAFEPDIGTGMWPWTSTQLPDRLDEPVLMAIDAPYAGLVGVSTVSGRWWSLGNGSAAAVSADGWRLAWWEGGSQELVIRDLADGTEQRLAAGAATEFDGIVIDWHIPLRWSPDGEAVAVTGTAGEVTVVRVDTGDVIEIDAIRGFVAGWLDNDRLVVVGHLNDDVWQEVSQVTLAGSVTSLGVLEPEPTGNEVVPTLSPDGRALAWFEYEADSGPIIDTFFLGSFVFGLGPRGDIACDCVPTDAPVWTPDGDLLVESRLPGPAVFGTVDPQTSTFDPMIAISPRLEDPTRVSLAFEVAAAGPAGEPHTGQWWPGWYVDWLSYAALALLVLAVLVARIILARRQRSPAGP